MTAAFCLAGLLPETGASSARYLLWDNTTTEYIGMAPTVITKSPARAISRSFSAASRKEGQ